MSSSGKKAPRRPSVPTLSVGLDLDAMTRPDTPTPFTIRLAGHTFTLRDPASVSWRALSQIASAPTVFLAATVEEPERERFAEAMLDMPAWQVNLASARYRAHFGLGDD